MRTVNCYCKSNHYNTSLITTIFDRTTELKTRDDLPSYVEANPQDIQLSEAYQYLLKMEQQFKDHVDKVYRSNLVK